MDTTLKGKTVIVSQLDNVVEWLRAQGVEGQLCRRIVHGGEIVDKIVYTTEQIPFSCARRAYAIIEVGPQYSSDALAKMTPEQLNANIQLQGYRTASLYDWVGRPQGARR